MKRFVLLAVSIVLVSIFFCPIVMAFPPITADVQIVQPDPSLPKELSAFFGKWECDDFFLIVAEINNKKASLYFWPTESNPYAAPKNRWYRENAKVIKVKGQYKLSYRTLPPWRDVEFYFLDNVLMSHDDTGQGRYKPAR